MDGWMGGWMDEWMDAVGMSACFLHGKNCLLQCQNISVSVLVLWPVSTIACAYTRLLVLQIVGANIGKELLPHFTSFLCHECSIVYWTNR